MKDLAYFYPDGHQDHYEIGHPERPERIETIRTALKTAGMWDRYIHLEPLILPEGVLQAIHSPGYLETIKEVSRKGIHFDADTYTTPASWELALKSAGGAAAVASYVWRGETKRGFALTRPPGHHATQNRAMGFCLLNNIALAAEYLFTFEGASRLAIIDLDLHHGNGTQDIFYMRSDVFYVSTHQYPLYPGTGWLEETGDGHGAKSTANFPLPPHSGDQAFSVILEELIIPLLERYQPEMILVSYGFDTHWSDPLGSLLLTSQGYGSLIERLVDWADKKCQGRIALFLEGGYNLSAAETCTLSVAAALLGDRVPESYKKLIDSSPQRESQAWHSIHNQAKQLWGIE
jgi:acetoin utilization deacetylase AcuC-like enzyme